MPAYTMTECSNVFIVKWHSAPSIEALREIEARCGLEKNPRRCAWLVLAGEEGPADAMAFGAFAKEQAIRLSAHGLCAVAAVQAKSSFALIALNAIGMFLFSSSVRCRLFSSPKVAAEWLSLQVAGTSSEELRAAIGAANAS